MKFTSIILSINRTKSHEYKYGLLLDDLISGFVKRLESLGYYVDFNDARTSWAAIAGDKISTFEIDYSEA